MSDECLLSAWALRYPRPILFCPFSPSLHHARCIFSPEDILSKQRHTKTFQLKVTYIANMKLRIRQVRG